MPATVRAVATGAENDGTIAVSKPTGTVDGDLLVAFCFGYATALADVTAPAGFTSRDTESDVTNNRHGKIFTKVAASEGASYTFGNTAAYDYFAVILVAVQGANTTTADGVDGTAASGMSASSDLTADCPSVSPTGSDSLLLCAAMSNGSTAAARTASWPGSMTEIADFQRPDQYDVYSAAREALSASGATGTRVATFTSGGQGGWLSFSVAIKSAAGGLPEGFVLIEDASFLLLENADQIVLEAGAPAGGPQGSVSGAVARGAGAVTGARVSAGAVTGAVARGAGSVTGKKFPAGSVAGAVARGAGTVVGVKAPRGAVTGAVGWGAGSVSGDAPAGAGTIWEEPFNYTDGADLDVANSAWVETAEPTNNWLISNPAGTEASGVAYASGVGMALRETGEANHRIDDEMFLYYPGGQLNAGIIAAAASNTQHLLAEFVVNSSGGPGGTPENKVGLYLRNGGTHTDLYELTGQTFASETTHTLGIGRAGDQATLYLDGTALHTATLTSGQMAILGTKVGIRTTWGITNHRHVTVVELAEPTQEGAVSGAVAWGAGTVNGARVSSGAVSGAVTRGAGAVTGARPSAGSVTGAVARGAGSVTGKRVAAGAVTGAVARGAGSVTGERPSVGTNDGSVSGAIAWGPGSVTGRRTSAGAVTGAVTRGPGAVTGARTSSGSVTGVVARGPGVANGERPAVGVNDGAVGGAVLRGPGAVTGLRPSLGTVTGAVLRGPGAVLGARPSSGSVLGAVVWGPGQVLGFAGSNLPGTVVLTVGQSVELDMTAPDVAVALSLAGTAVLTLEG